MRSIRKIVSTPVKWASRELLHRTLLRFPGGDSDDPVACAFCPEMCRFSCPTAVTSGNDAVTPAAKMGLLHARREWPEQAEKLGEPWPIYDCTGCGRCTEYCVYGVSVADQLFEARSEGHWTRARQAAAMLSDAEDPWGDLAAELGCSSDSEKRTRSWVDRNSGSVGEVDEPKAVFHLGMAGASVALSSQPLLLMGAHADHPAWALLANRLAGRRWVVYESVWLARRLGRFEQLRQFVSQARSKGIELSLSTEKLPDVQDCGGEGAYSRLFPEIARRMAGEWWERARERSSADAILSMSPRAAVLFRRVLGDSVRIVDASELWRELTKGGWVS